LVLQPSSTSPAESNQLSEVSQIGGNADASEEMASGPISSAIYSLSTSSCGESIGRQLMADTSRPGDKLLTGCY